jgi:hypothetical protein
MIAFNSRLRKNQPQSNFEKVPHNSTAERQKRFEQFLRDRGCPTRLAVRESEKEIRWLG